MAIEPLKLGAAGRAQTEMCRKYKTRPRFVRLTIKKWNMNDLINNVYIDYMLKWKYF